MDKIEVLKFYADWCGPCRVLSKVLESKDYIKNINIDVDHETAVMHNVRRIPTLIFLKDGVEKHRTTGIITEYEYNIIVDELMVDKPLNEIKVHGASIVAAVAEALEERNSKKTKDANNSKM